MTNNATCEPPEFVFTHHVMYPTTNVTDGQKQYTPKKYRANKRTWQSDAYLCVRSQMRKAGFEGFTGPVEISYLLMFADRHERDQCNYPPKWLNDVLVQAGVFEDDRSSICHQSAPEFVYGADEDMIVVRVRPKTT